jgi:hypothetical protein
MITRRKTENNCWQGYRETGSLVCCRWEFCKMVQLLWRTEWQFLKMELPCNPGIPVLVNTHKN